MFCPKCGSENTKVVASIKGAVKERTRKCLDCGFTFMTIEALKYDPIWKEYARFIKKEVLEEISR